MPECFYQASRLLLRFFAFAFALLSFCSAVIRHGWRFRLRAKQEVLPANIGEVGGLPPTIPWRDLLRQRRGHAVAEFIGADDVHRGAGWGCIGGR